MNPVDIFIVAVLGYGLVRGIFRGLVKELSSIIGVLAGFYVAYTYYPLLARHLRGWIASAGYLHILSFVAIFCLVLIVVNLLAMVIKYLLNIAFLGWVDRICGAGFGVLKGILVTAVILLVLTAFLPAGTPVLRGSQLAPRVIRFSDKLAKVVSPGMRRSFNTNLNSLEKAWRVPSKPQSKLP